ncbi:MAG: RHS repeat-associated core domain-containing protein [Chloroflexota bacterium]
MATFYANTTQELIDAINSANSNGQTNTIYLQNRTYQLTTAYFTAPLGNTGLPGIESNLIIEGNGATLQRDSSEEFRFIYSPSGIVTIQNLTFENGYLSTSSGGAIRKNNGTLQLYNCNFMHNSAQLGGAIGAGYFIIENCLFTGNSGRGGAIYRNFASSGSNSLIKDSTFTQNGGSAIENRTLLSIEGCNFNNNSTTGSGAAINNKGTLHVKDTDFDSNNAGGGGAIAGINQSNQILTFENCSFTNNTATSTLGRGGAIYLVQGQELSAKNCKFENNASIFQNGNAIYIQDMGNNARINRSRIASNSGNAVYCSGTTILDATRNDWGAPDGPSGVASGSGDGISANVQYIPFIGVSGPPKHTGKKPRGKDCSTGFASKGQKATRNPISLSDGEKRLDETDIQINTPLGTLEFTRFYEQSQQDTLSFMGLGWTHSHVYNLVEDGSTPNEIVVTISGSKLVFEDDNADGIFEASEGSVSKIVKSGSDYDLIASDESVYHFNSSGQLLTHTLNNNEVWTYSYDGNDNLIDVSDGYGRELKFAYYSGLGGADAFKNDLLWRVGTHQATDLTLTTPAGPYIELDYSDDGSGDALLTDVTDVRGNTWAYRYYGSDPSETDTKWTNFLVETFSPSVDSDGDGSADGTIQLQELTYSGATRDEISQIVQKRGDNLVTTTMDFDPTNNVTTETTEGLITTHNFINGVYLGTKDAEDNEQIQQPFSNYRPAYQDDANGNRSITEWSDDGKLLNSISDALNNQTQFSYDSQDRLIASTDAEGRVTNYIYEGARRQPSQIMVADSQASELAINGDMEASSDWSEVGTPTTSQQSQTEVSDGDYSWYVDAATGEGIQSTTKISFDAGKDYLITARVYVIGSGEQIQMGISNSTDWDVTSSSDGEWETLRAIHTPSSALTEKLQFLAEGGTAEFYVDSVHVVELTGLHRWQQFVYDEKDRTLGEYLLEHETASELQATERVYGDDQTNDSEAYGLLKEITVKDVLDNIHNSTTQYDYDAQGRVIRTHKISMFGSCEYNHTVYDEAGNVLGTACGLVTDSNSIPDSITDLNLLYDAADAHKKHTKITAYSYDEMGRRVTSSTSGAVTARTNRTIYDALGRVVRTIQNYIPETAGMVAYTGPGTWVWDGTQWLDDASTPVVIEHGADLDENIIAITSYNKRGLVNMRRDVLGRVTLYGYNDADRLVKTVQNATKVPYDGSNPITATDYDMRYGSGDPALDDYDLVASSQSDEDIITEQVYDPNGNVIMSTDTRGSVTFTVYNALNRPVKVISNAAQPSYDILTDLSLSVYGAYSTEPDQDMVSTTEYDAMGRVIRSQRLLENRGATEEWDTMLYGYDALGRQVRSIQHAATPDYDLSADPDLSAYTISTDTDVDMLTQTRYDVQGRVLETEDVNGRITRMVYDGLNRQVLTIANYVLQATAPENWEWVIDQWEDGVSVAIDHGVNDQNIITQTVYDSDGRVESTRNVEGLVARNAYDVAGRSLLSIQNFVDNSYVDPAGVNSPTNPKDPWSWDGIRWEDGDGTAIARGTNFDQNLISKPDYDDENRVFQTRDARGNLTRQVYDDSGRQVLSIANYVEQGNPVVEPENWEWANNRWEDGSGNAIDHGVDKDQNRISSTEYDLLGRAFRTRDAAGRETYTVYDAVGRVVRRVNNYVAQASTLPDDWAWNDTAGRYEYSAGNAVDLGTAFDQNIISETTYNQAGQVVSTRDAFGTQSSFVYDEAGRRLQVTQASNTGLATSSYTCFDKAGRTLRTIANYIPKSDGVGGVISPDAWDTDANWIFHPAKYLGRETNIISEILYDRASRRVRSINPMGNISQTSYSKDGQVDSMTDPEGMVTVYRYDGLRRRTLVVQSYVDNGEDPENWVWDTNQYEESDGTAIAHGTDNDQNIIVTVDYDIAGRMLSMRDPRGNLTTYDCDALGRRTKLTNPLGKEWETAYAEVSGAQQTTMTYPGLNGSTTPYDVVRDFDRMGRLQQIDYNDAANTPTVSFAYDIVGNRLTMTEHNGTADVRITNYDYDNRNRLTEVGFDTDGDSTVDETVSYEYDIRGLRTKLTMPGSLSIAYSYDEKGRLVSLEDWDNQKSDFAYDALNRHVATLRANGMRSSYTLDGAGRLRQLRHENRKREILATFRYTVDGRGNRTRTEELRLEPSATVATATIDHEDSEIVYTGDWTNDTILGFHQTSQWDAKMALLFVGDTDVDLTIGEGPDHSIVDIYIDGTLYKSIDGYAASAASRVVSLDLRGDGFHLLELRNRHEKNMASSGYTLRFKQLAVDSALTHDVIDYSYDALSRLLQADYNDGATVYNYGYDVAGNMTNYDGVTRTYNAANQMTNDGTNTLTYDNNGNLTGKGTDTYVWDRANRLLDVGNHSYVYDGVGNRVQQMVSSVVTDYLNDLQPGLTKLLKQDDGTNVEHFVHAPRGIHAVDDGTDWNFYMQDGLGSVRAVVDDMAAVQTSMSFDPYGNPMASYGAGFGFTGEQTDANGSVFLRARYYEPGLGTFSALDPLEGKTCTPMTLNGYSWVEGNPVMNTDPAGLLSCEAAAGACGTAILVPFDGFFGDIPACGILIGCLGIVGALAALAALTTSQVDVNISTSTSITTTAGECPTDYHPGTYFPFLNESDILCNLRKHGGGRNPFGTATYEMLRYNNKAPVINPNFPMFDANARYAPPDPIWPDGQYYEPGGIIYVSPPSITVPRGTRADRLASLVEEIQHAAQFFGFDNGRGCNTRLIEGEIAAKGVKLLWMTLSNIEPASFTHTAEAEFQDSLGTYVRNLYGGDESTPLFRNALGNATCVTELTSRDFPTSVAMSIGYNPFDMC